PTAQLPPLQAGVACGVVHTVLQLPQLETLVWMLTSQPSPTVPSQSSKPGLHAAIAQLPLEHAGVPLASEQLDPHAPQVATVGFRFTSHPSPGLPWQSANGGVQLLTPQLPFVHVGVPFGAVQMLPQPPQLETLVWVLASHPSAALPLQSANGLLHDAMTQSPP